MLRRSIIDKLSPQHPTMIVIKNLERQYIWATDLLALFLGFKDAQSLIGRTDNDFSFLENYLAQIKANDIEALKGNNVVGIEKTNWPYFGDILTLCTKLPLYDDENNLMGIYAHYSLLHDHPLAASPATLLPTIKDNAKAYLSRRETQVLYYSLQGMTSKKAATLLGISSKTVEYYIDKLKVKLQCKTKPELIEFAIAKGYASSLPPAY